MASGGADLAAALAEWRAILGAAHVVEDEASLRAAETATFATTQGIPAILRPGSSDDVRECLKTATRLGVPVWPVSRGRNWGFGSRVPARAGCALMDLGRMDRILAFDERLAHVSVEPGVSFRQLHEFLRKGGSRLMLNTTGGSPEASVVGNALERGDGAGPYADRFAHVAGLEVVLPTGERLHTGFGRFGDGPLAPLHRWGVGPALDGLFSQSNLGVVTRMTVWLAPAPPSLQAVRFGIDDPARLGGMVEALRALRMDGTLRAGVGVWNDYRALSTRGGYPWAAAGGATPLPRAVLDRLAGEAGLPSWAGLAGLHAASAAIGAAMREHVEAALGPHVDGLSFEAVRVGSDLEGTDPGLLFLQGVPHEAGLRSVYWRKRRGPGSRVDPEGDRCGVLWLCPTVPFTGEDVARAVGAAEDLMPAHGFEPLLAFLGHSERCGYLLPAIVYDRELAGEDERARRCHDALLDRYCRLGYLPHRLGIQSMLGLPAATDDHRAALRRLKAALDPADVLAPGRYDA